jgi:hypothetical protein
MPRTPEQIENFITLNMHKFDLGVQYLGTEPNATRRPWNTATIRWCLLASWPYEAAAGNQSIPAVYKTIHDHNEHFLCDRFYLPATPGDMKLMEKNGIPVFGIETKHQLTDFDIIATSISYPVLSMSFIKMLTMSEIPARWKDRDPNTTPMVMVGGLSYGAPEVLAPVVDCWFLGEAEDEPGNPGIGTVTDRIAAFKTQSRWHTNRLDCYADLAKEFNFLYFPRFVHTIYNHEDRSHVGVGPHPSKQVIGYTSLLDGMRLPLRKRHVKDLDAIPPLDNPPLLYADPSMGSGDLEVARGCPAWSIPVDAQVEIAGRGLVRFDSVIPGESIRSGGDHFQIAGVVLHGEKTTVRVQTKEGHEVECTPEHEIQVVRADALSGKNLRTLGGKRRGLDAAPREWVSADQLCPGDYLQYFYGSTAWSNTLQNLKDVRSYKVGRPRRDGSQAEREYSTVYPPCLTADVGWFLGAVTGDCSLRKNQLEFRVEERAWPVGDRIRHLAKELFEVEVTTVPSRDGPTTLYRVNSARLIKWLAVNFNISSNDTRLRVPKQIFESPQQVVAEYMSALYDANGTHLAPKSAGSTSTLRFVVYSEPFVREVAELFRLLGLPTAVRSELRGTKRNGEPSVKWEVRTTSPDDGEYSWLRSLDPFKSRFIEEHFHAPATAGRAKGQDGLAYLTVTGLRPGRQAQVMDVDVPGVQSFNVQGVKVHNCSFCALSYRQKPYRQRTVDYVVNYAKTLQSNMGSTRMAPFSPDLPMYTQPRKLIVSLLEQVSDEVDAASMRVDDFNADETFILLQVQGGMDSVTLGVEGNSQRMRDLVGKGTSDADIKEAVTRGIRAGIRKFKLFMISNLPGEDEGDVYRILKLAKDLADIRESMNQPTVRIQFSWTPLMIEANTPFQWFAPPPSSRILGDVWEEFRDLKIDFKIGAKAEENKIAFFQLCQRASRDVGEALVDAMVEVNQACWGGVPRTFKALIEEKLHLHGFDNGYDDCFDERFKNDMFGWEFVDQGISTELLWQTYVQMREFAEITDSHTYDMNFGSDYHGSEWLARCDERCFGKTCGTCDYKDLKYRNNYIRAAQHDIDVDLTTVKSVDQRSQAVRIRAKITKRDDLRYVGNDHWRFLFRRACFRAMEKMNPSWGIGIAKRSIRFASDEVKYRDWTTGTDYVEFALTRPTSDERIADFLNEVHLNLEERMDVLDWRRHPVDAVTIRHDVGSVLFSVELDADIELVKQRLTWWNTSTTIPMRLKVEGGYFAPQTEQVNAKDFVDDMWIKPDGHRFYLRMLVHGRPNPYNIVAALMGKQSWLPYAKKSAERLDVFIHTDRTQQDFLRPNCEQCGLIIPITLMDQPYHPQFCPRCLDERKTADE